MSADKKFVYSVTLNEPVAAELRRFDSKGKLSRGITRAQELLSLPHVLEYALAVESNQVEAFYARFYSGLYKTTVRAPTMPVEPSPAAKPAPKAPDDFYDEPEPPEEPSSATSTPPDLDASTQAVASIERDLVQGPMDPGATASAAAASTASASATPDAGTIAETPVTEPQF